MIKEQAEKLAIDAKIDISQIVREEWEMKILNILFDSEIGKKIYFQGGTALRLAYDSPRFSEDLDFTQIKKITNKELSDFLSKIKKTYPEISLSDFKDKFYTILIEFKIKENYLPRNFSIKIEISKREKIRYKYSLLLLTSKTTNIQVLANVENTEEIYNDKITALKSRGKARDLFDLWFISQKMKTPLAKNLPKISKKEIRSKLSKFLPRDYFKVIEMLEQNYGK